MKFGYTEGCRGCRNMKSGFTRSTHHSNECRTRMEELMQGDARTKARLDKASERITGVIADKRKAIAEATERPMPDDIVVDNPSSSSGVKRKPEEAPAAIDKKKKPIE